MTAAALARRAMPNAAKLQELKDSLLRQVRRAGKTCGSYRCRVCGSRVDIEIRCDTNFKEISSTGECRTPHCMRWEK